MLLEDLHQSRDLCCRMATCLHMFIEVWSVMDISDTAGSKVALRWPPSLFTLDQRPVKKYEVRMVLDAEPNCEKLHKKQIGTERHTGTSIHGGVLQSWANMVGVDDSAVHCSMFEDPYLLWSRFPRYHLW